MNLDVLKFGGLIWDTMKRLYSRIPHKYWCLTHPACWDCSLDAWRSHVLERRFAENNLLHWFKAYTSVVPKCWCYCIAKDWSLQQHHMLRERNMYADFFLSAKLGARSNNELMLLYCQRWALFASHERHRIFYQHN
jgi:hypothetical protein